MNGMISRRVGGLEYRDGHLGNQWDRKSTPAFPLARGSGRLAGVPPGIRPAWCPRGGVPPAVFRDSSTYLLHHQPLPHPHALPALRVSRERPPKSRINPWHAHMHTALHRDMGRTLVSLVPPSTTPPLRKHLAASVTTVFPARARR